MCCMTAKTMLQHFGKNPLKDLPLAARLVWAWIHENGTGRYSSRQLGTALGITHVAAKNALDLLEQENLILILEKAAGSVSALIEPKPL
jgi:hypothetical protein